eukprot:5512323-Alexandrium_andersonii.AAC.1
MFCGLARPSGASAIPRSSPPIRSPAAWAGTRAGRVRSSPGGSSGRAFLRWGPSGLPSSSSPSVAPGLLGFSVAPATALRRQ